MNEKELDKLITDTWALHGEHVACMITRLEAWEQDMRKLLAAQRQEIGVLFEGVNGISEQAAAGILCSKVAAAICAYGNTGKPESVEHKKKKKKPEQTRDTGTVADPDQALLTPVPLTGAEKKQRQRDPLIKPRNHAFFNPTDSYDVRLSKTRQRVQGAKQTYKTSSQDELCVAKLMYLFKAEIKAKKLKTGVPVPIAVFLRNNGYGPVEQLERLVVMEAFEALTGISHVKMAHTATCVLSPRIKRMTDEDIVDILQAMSLPMPPPKELVPTVLEHLYPPTMNWYYAKKHRLLKGESLVDLKAAGKEHGSAKGDDSDEDNAALKQWRPPRFEDAMASGRYMLTLLKLDVAFAIRAVREHRQGSSTLLSANAAAPTARFTRATP